jgi:hypothetical protein
MFLRRRELHVLNKRRESPENRIFHVPKLIEAEAGVRPA